MEDSWDGPWARSLQRPHEVGQRNPADSLCCESPDRLRGPIGAHTDVPNGECRALSFSEFLQEYMAHVPHPAAAVGHGVVLCGAHATRGESIIEAVRGLPEVVPRV